MIIISNDGEAKKLYTNGFYFGEIVKMIEKYQEVGLGSIYIRYYRLRHEWLGSYGDKPEKYLLYAEPYQASNH